MAPRGGEPALVPRVFSCSDSRCGYALWAGRSATAAFSHDRAKKRGKNIARAAWVASFAALALPLVSGSARADITKAQCIEANTKGQDLRRDGNLAAARDVFRTCAVASCPALLRDDCTRRIDEIERVQPTIVFDAKDASGRDVSVVKVTIDGKPLADRLAGTPLQIDPGEHVFAFQVPGQAPVTQTFIIKENERDRRERVVLGGPAPGSSVPSPGTRATASRRRGGDGGRPFPGQLAGERIVSTRRHGYAEGPRSDGRGRRGGGGRGG